MDGKTIRLNRLLHDGKMLCVPLDHAVTTNDIAHLVEFEKTVEAIIENGASTIIIHKGMVRFLPPLKTTGLIVHLSASTLRSKQVHKVIVCEVEEAIRLGADAVSVHVNLGNDYEKKMLQDFSRISRECQIFGLPLFAMMYIRNNDNEDISTPEAEEHSIRIATELGADIVKIGSNWDYPEQLTKVINNALIPVVVAGGEVLDSERLFSLTKRLMKTGIIGVSFGRNVFMSNDPASTVKQLSKIIYN